MVDGGKIMTENVVNKTVAVGTTSVVISPTIQAPSFRKLITITNTSTAGQIITVSFGTAVAVAGEGIVIYPTGSWYESMDSQFKPSQEQINVIASAITGSVGVHERIITVE